MVGRVEVGSFLLIPKSPIRVDFVFNFAPLLTRKFPEREERDAANELK